MPGGGSKPGERRGGRKAGTPNRSSADLRALIDAAISPEDLIAGLVRLAEEGELEATRLQAHRELMDRRFGRPKPEACEGDGPVAITIFTGVPQSSEHG